MFAKGFFLWNHACYSLFCQENPFLQLCHQWLRDSLVLSPQTCPIGGPVAAWARRGDQLKRAGNQDWQIWARLASGVFFLVLNRVNTSVNAKTDCELWSHSWNMAVEEGQHKHSFSAAPCIDQQVTTSGRQDLCSPHACCSWSGILQLFQVNWVHRLPLFTLGSDNRRNGAS